MSTPAPTSGLEQIRCAACGEDFGCGANASCESSPLDCWCSTIKVSEATLEEVQARYQGCLCRRCLTGFVEGER